jgi:hypothetical protein
MKNKKNASLTCFLMIKKIENCDDAAKERTKQDSNEYKSEQVRNDL